MEIIRRHEWQVSPSEAVKIQTALAGEVSRTGNIEKPRYFAGVDISVNRWAKMGTGAVVILSYPGLEIVETRVVTDHIGFSYVPGLLSFRELPLILAAYEKLTITPDIIMVDGQGIAHPRRIGLASHLGLILGVSTIGCAKSRLCGRYVVPGSEAGSYSDLVDKDEVIGAVLRTRTGVRPIYVSIGHKIDLTQAIRWVLACCRGYRLPEPTRLAHQAAGGNLKTKTGTAVIGRH